MDWCDHPSDGQCIPEMNHFYSLEGESRKRFPFDLLGFWVICEVFHFLDSTLLIDILTM